MTTEKKHPLSTIKRWAKRDARQLGYLHIMPDILERIDNARTENEVYRVLTTARESIDY